MLGVRVTVPRRGSPLQQHVRSPPKLLMLCCLGPTSWVSPRCAYYGSIRPLCWRILLFGHNRQAWMYGCCPIRLVSYVGRIAVGPWLQIPVHEESSFRTSHTSDRRMEETERSQPPPPTAASSASATKSAVVAASPVSESGVMLGQRRAPGAHLGGMYRGASSSPSAASATSASASESESAILSDFMRAGTA